MSSITAVVSLAKTLMLPPLPAGTIAALDLMRPSRELRVESQGGGVGGRHEVAVDVQHHIGGITGEHTDASAASGRHDSGIGFDAAVQGVEGRGEGLRLTGGPQGEIAERPGGYHRHVEGIGQSGGGHAASAAGDVEVAADATP